MATKSLHLLRSQKILCKRLLFMAALPPAENGAAIRKLSGVMGEDARRVNRGFKQGRGTGDSGQSSLFNNERRWKDDVVFEALGSIDELSSLLGVCRAAAASTEVLEDVVDVLTRVQCCLQDVGGHVATPPESTDRKRKLTSFDNDMLVWLNAEIDRFGDELPTIRQFILSGGGQAAASLQYSRAVCRRAERNLVPLVREHQIDPKALKFLNRLSDLLFVMGRYACMKCEEEEITYLRPAEFTGSKWHRKMIHDE